MEANSSGEELVIKTRKRYTITKQRERWTEEEHDRFLEALKLYGRAWQKIEEHIGTKTAVQIRSHAQKFFSKLEKEAHAKGIPVGQALDIDIPPPRPKRKPSSPYPRKTGNGSPTSQGAAKDGKLVTSASSLHCKEALECEKGALSQKPNEERQSSNRSENQEGNCSNCFTHFREAHCCSVSSVNKSSVQTAAFANSFTFREFLPSREGASQDTGEIKASNLEKQCNLHPKSVQGFVEGNVNDISLVDEQGPQTYPRHASVHVLNGSSITCALSPLPTRPLRDSLVRPMEEIHGCSNSTDPSASAGRSEHRDDTPRSNYQGLPAFHPSVALVPHTPDDYRSFANLIMSTLLQNPAVHAAANFAASFWPHNTGGSSTCTEGGFPAGQVNSPPSLAAIAAATVAAATAWWAAHGLLPLCAPFHSAFPCHPPSTTSVPSGDNGQASAAKLDRKGAALRIATVQNQDLDPERSEASQAQCSASKSTSSPSDSEESESAKPKTGPKPDCHEEPAAETDPNGPNETKNRKQVDRSSCGSNTPSSSDVELDASEKLEKGKDEVKEVDAEANPPATESNTRRTRSSNNLNEYWKAVSEEVLGQGRLAFQALFSREVLPQSFSSPHDAKNKRNAEEDKKKNTKVDHGDALALDLNSNTQAAASDHQQKKRTGSSNGENMDHAGFLAIGLGTSKLKGRKTGFKPYKRCSVEAKENRIISATSVTQVEQRDPKRIRLEREAST